MAVSEYTRLEQIVQDEERKACLEINPAGFHLRDPPPPHEIKDFITEDGQLFQTIHMGAAVVDESSWRVVVDGLVQMPLSISLEQLKTWPSATVTTFHECYGNPLKPPVEPSRRVGNVRWTGVRLKDILEKAVPHLEARYVWSDGLDSGTFAGKESDRYQKDMCLEKAKSEEVLVAYLLNGEPLDKLRGGPVRLVVPGWFGTNSTKWLCRLSLHTKRSQSHYTTTLYNELRPGRTEKTPIWAVEPNSIIVSPQPNEQVQGASVTVRGWAWSCDGISKVEVKVNDGSWTNAQLQPRKDFSWQEFVVNVELAPGRHVAFARATCRSGEVQPMTGRRNQVSTTDFDVLLP